jgi:hypothetical protein
MIHRTHRNNIDVKPILIYGIKEGGLGFGVLRVQAVRSANPSIRGEMLATEFATVAGTIRDSTVKSLFKRLSRRSETEEVAALTQFIDLIPTLDYATTFTETIGHVCFLFDHLLFHPSPEVRLLSIRLMGCVILRLKADVADYSTLIFPTLLIYMNDGDSTILAEAKSVFNASFPTSAEKAKFLRSVQGDVCDRIKTVLASLSAYSTRAVAADSAASWGRVASAAIGLACTLLGAFKINKTIEWLLPEFRVFEWLRIEDGDFLKAAVPQLRLSCYNLLFITAGLNRPLYESPQAVLGFLRYEGSPVAQPGLIKLILHLLKSGLPLQEVRIEIVASVHRYLDPDVPGFRELLEQTMSVDLVCQCLERIVVLAQPRKLFELFMTFDPPEEVRLRLFERAISKDSNGADRFLSDYPLDSFRDLAPLPSIDPILQGGLQLRVLQFAKYLTVEKVARWLRSCESTLPSTLLAVIKQYGPDVVRAVWKTLPEIPFASIESDELFSDFLVTFANGAEFLAVLDTHPTIVPFVLRKWNRDFSILRSKRLKKEAEKLLEEDTSLIHPFKMIFPDDDEISDSVGLLVMKSVEKYGAVDSRVFQYFTPTDDFLYFVLMLPNARKLTNDHPLVTLLADFLPRIPIRTSVTEIARAISEFVTACHLDPARIKIPNIDLFYEVWAMLGFKRLPAPQFCDFLDRYLVHKLSWITVFLYTREVNWQIVPQKLWDYVAEAPELAPIAHSMKLQLALACICAANSLDFASSLPCDALTLSAIPHIVPPRELPDDPLIRVIRMEWRQIRPKPPDFDSPDMALALRQTVAYIQFFLPTLLVFDPVYDLLFRALADADRLTLFYCLRILSLIADATSEIPAARFLRAVAKYLAVFAPFLSVIETELISVFRLAKLLSPEDFRAFVVSQADSVCPEFVRLIVPLFEYFNGWDFIPLDGRLDLDSPANWDFVTHCLAAMPPLKRIALIPQFARCVPGLLSGLSTRSKEFELIAMTFPVTVAAWFETLDFHRKAEVQAEIERRIVVKIFKSISKTILRLKLEKTVLRTVQQHLVIGLTYREDGNAAPINLELRLPPDFPLRKLTMVTDISDRELREACEARMYNEMLIAESVEAGAKAWHSFVVSRVEDGHPCTICYRYFDDDRTMPQTRCGTCSNAFHAKCLRKWFERCLRPICPHCACVWKKVGKA